MRRIVTAVLALCIAGAAWSAEPPAGVKAVLEARSRQFFYAGEPFPLRISVGNEGDESVVNPVKTPLVEGFDVRDADGVPLERKGKADAAEPTRPDRIAPGSGYFHAVDLTQLYPRLLQPGEYRVRWSSAGISSDTLTVRMIPRYDPAKRYVASVETDLGVFTIDFFPDSAPVATKAFIDMANAGFYDGLTIHKVVADAFVEGGDPQGDGSGSPPFAYPAELSGVPVVAGTVVMKPVSPSPPSNGSQFLVMLRPEPSWNGQVTVLGQVISGLEAVRRISRMPSTEQSERPPFRPLKEIRIRSIAVHEKDASKSP